MERLKRETELSKKCVLFLKALEITAINESKNEALDKLFSNIDSPEIIELTQDLHKIIEYQKSQNFFAQSFSFENPEHFIVLCRAILPDILNSDLKIDKNEIECRNENKFKNTIKIKQQDAYTFSITRYADKNYISEELKEQMSEKDKLKSNEKTIIADIFAAKFINEQKNMLSDLQRIKVEFFKEMLEEQKCTFKFFGKLDKKQPISYEEIENQISKIKNLENLYSQMESKSKNDIESLNFCTQLKPYITHLQENKLKIFQSDKFKSYFAEINEACKINKNCFTPCCLCASKETANMKFNCGHLFCEKCIADNFNNKISQEKYYIAPKCLIKYCSYVCTEQEIGKILWKNIIKNNEKLFENKHCCLCFAENNPFLLEICSENHFACQDCIKHYMQTYKNCIF